MSDKQTNEAVDKFKKSLNSSGAKINHEEAWGLKKLAYPIQKKSTGFYFLIQFEAPGEAIQKLEVEFKRDERVMRFLTMRMDKDHFEWAEKRRTKQTPSTDNAENKNKVSFATKSKKKKSLSRRKKQNII